MKPYFLFLFVVVFCVSLKMNAQTESGNDLLNEISTKDSVSLLPQKMIITQRMFWGEKGVMRNFERFELTPEKRQNELKLRRVMLSAHQVTGFMTLAGMIGQGVVGFQLYNGKTSLRETHEILATGVNICYISTASFALFSPPKMMNERAGFSSIKVHKNLAIIHMLGMIATNVLADKMQSDPSLRPYHRAAAITTFVALEASMLVIKF